MFTFCDGGVLPPVTYPNIKAVGLATRLGGPAAATVNDTFTRCGLFPAPVAVTVTVPLYVPAVSPDVFTPTLMLPGVLPLAGDAVSHAADVPTV